MKTRFRHHLNLFSGTKIAIVLICFVLSCNETKHEEALEYFSLPDSIKAKEVIAVFKEEESTSVLVYTDSNKKQVFKCAYFKNGLTFLDSLHTSGADTFYSKKFRTHYIITAKTIQLIHEQKIIHPSSNWQGQTPWKETRQLEYKKMKFGE